MSDSPESTRTISSAGLPDGASVSRDKGLSTLLANCLSVAIEDLEGALYGIDPAIFARYLACNHDPVLQLRESLDLDPRKIDANLICEALLAPEGQISAALLAALGRMAVDELVPETVLLERLQVAKVEVVNAWTRAMEFAAPHGYIAADDAYLIGIGEAVYLALLAHAGNSSIEALSREAFLTLAPRLVETWPATEEGLASLSKLHEETEEFIRKHLRRRARTGDLSVQLRRLRPAETSPRCETP